LNILIVQYLLSLIALSLSVSNSALSTPLSNTVTTCPSINRKQKISHQYKAADIIIYLSMAVQPFIGPCLLFSFLVLYTVGVTSWTGDQLVIRPLFIHRATKTQNKFTQYRHPCLEWDSKPLSQCSSGRRLFMP
jgi:hypothetical protein